MSIIEIFMFFLAFNIKILPKIAGNERTFYGKILMFLTGVSDVFILIIGISFFVINNMD
jgi:hypothetical protein